MSIETEVISMIETLLKRRGLPTDGLNASAHLYAEGLGLDSLGAAELSVMLENKYGKDPYSSAQIPDTIADILDFYSNS